MKTDVEVKQDVYMIVAASALASELKGEISYQGRDQYSDNEDCIIQINSNVNGQIQECDVRVKIYVQNINSGGRSVENILRTGPLAKLASEVLEVGSGDTFRFRLDSQSISPVNGKDEHVISNKLRYKQLNE